MVNFPYIDQSYGREKVVVFRVFSLRRRRERLSGCFAAHLRTEIPSILLYIYYPHNQNKKVALGLVRALFAAEGLCKKIVFQGHFFGQWCAFLLYI